MRFQKKEAMRKRAKATRWGNKLVWVAGSRKCWCAANKRKNIHSISSKPLRTWNMTRDRTG